MVTVTAPKIIQNKTKAYLRTLPLVDFTANLYHDIDLEKTYIICAQHLVSTTYTLFHTLLKHGLKPENLSVIGKCYSTDPQAYDQMVKQAIDVCPSSLTFDSHSSFDKQYRKNIRKFLKARLNKLTTSKFKKIIILDDGGELILAATHLLKTNKNIIGIEQTSSGFQKLKDKLLKFPIINVARSPAKLNYESPIIAKLVVDTIIDQIARIHSHPHNVLIIGNGPIGSQIGEVLKNDYNISIFDVCASKSSIAPKDFVKSLGSFDMIIGCTGSKVIKSRDYRLLKKNTILISASSSDREFDSACLRRKMPLVENCHENLLINDIYLLNCGFPINFSADYRAIDADELQLTRSLLLAAIFQAVCHPDVSEEGFIPLDIENQREIIGQYFAIFNRYRLH